MLSIEESRKHLEGLDLTDKDVERIRDGLYFFVNQILDNSYEKEPPKKH